jgi:hypothetical protein
MGHFVFGTFCSWDVLSPDFCLGAFCLGTFVGLSDFSSSVTSKG